MDRLVPLKILIIFSMLFAIMATCTRTPSRFIYWNEILEKFPDSSQQHLDDLDQLLFFGTELVAEVNARHPGLIAKRHKDLNKFVIEEQHKVIVNLEKTYESVEDIASTLEPSVVEILKKRFGVSDPVKDLYSRILIYKNMAFIQFDGEASIHAFTFELRQPDQLVIGLAFIAIE